MQFSITDQFDCSPQRLWELLEDDEEVARRLQETTQERRELVEQDTDNGVEHLRIRCVSMREIPAMMQKALGIERLEYERDQRLDRDAGVMNWEVTTPFLTDRVDVTATTRVSATDDGCRRVVEGQVDIQLPLVGKKMEGKLADRIRDGEQAAGRIVRELLDEPAGDTRSDHGERQ